MKMSKKETWTYIYIYICFSWSSISDGENNGWGDGRVWCKVSCRFTLRQKQFDLKRESTVSTSRSWTRWPTSWRWPTKLWRISWGPFSRLSPKACRLMLYVTLNLTYLHQMLKELEETLGDYDQKARQHVWRLRQPLVMICGLWLGHDTRKRSDL